MLIMAKFAMNNAMSASTSKTPFFLNYRKLPMTPNIQESSIRLAQVSTPREEYEYFVLESAADQILAVVRYSEYFQKTLEKVKLWIEQAQSHM